MQITIYIYFLHNIFFFNIKVYHHAPFTFIQWTLMDTVFEMIIPTKQ